MVLEHFLEIFHQKYIYFVRQIEAMDNLFEDTFTTLAQSGKNFSRCKLPLNGSALIFLILFLCTIGGACRRSAVFKLCSASMFANDTYFQQIYETSGFETGETFLPELRCYLFLTRWKIIQIVQRTQVSAWSIRTAHRHWKRRQGLSVLPVLLYLPALQVHRAKTFKCIFKIINLCS